MRELLVKYLALSYDTKVFGQTWSHLRCVNVLMPLFVVMGVTNLLTGGFGALDLILLLNFLAAFIFVVTYFKSNPVKVEELDWEQKFQYAKAKPGSVTPEEFKALQEMWKLKYQSSSSFVEAGRFFWPLLWIVGAAIVYYIFGSTEVGFSELRGF